jgi:hypothetical protein
MFTLQVAENVPSHRLETAARAVGLVVVTVHVATLQAVAAADSQDSLRLGRLHKVLLS